MIFYPYRHAHHRYRIRLCGSVGLESVRGMADRNPQLRPKEVLLLRPFAAELSLSVRFKGGRCGDGRSGYRLYGAYGLQHHGKREQYQDYSFALGAGADLRRIPEGIEQRDLDRLLSTEPFPAKAQERDGEGGGHEGMAPGAGNEGSCRGGVGEEPGAIPPRVSGMVQKMPDEAEFCLPCPKRYVIIFTAGNDKKLTICVEPDFQVSLNQMEEETWLRKSF